MFQAGGEQANEDAEEKMEEDTKVENGDDAKVENDGEAEAGEAKDDETADSKDDKTIDAKDDEATDAKDDKTDDAKDDKTDDAKDDKTNDAKGGKQGRGQKRKHSGPGARDRRFTFSSAAYQMTHVLCVLNTFSVPMICREKMERRETPAPLEDLEEFDQNLVILDICK